MHCTTLRRLNHPHVIPLQPFGDSIKAIQFKGRLSALRHPSYFRYWTGSFACIGATQLQTMAQGWLLFKLTDSAIFLGYLGAAAAIPAITMTLFGGVLADNLNKKHLLMATSFCVSILMAIMAWLDGSGLVMPWHILLIAATVSFISGFDWPTRAAILPSLIDREDMMSAVALNSIIWQSSRMIMPAFGGLLIASVDTWLVFLLCSLGFLIMFFVVAGLKINMPKVVASGKSTLHQIKEGLLFIFDTKIFLVFLTLSYAGMFFGTSHLQLMPAFTALLGTSEQGYGILISSTGVGSVIGTILVGSLQSSKHLGKVILGAAMASALMIFGFVFATANAETLLYAFEISIASVMFTAIFSSMFMISAMTVLQLQVKDNLRGRVMGIYGITYSLMPLGGLFAGWIASFSSAPTAIGIGATIYLFIIILIAMTQSEVRNLSSQQ